MDQEIDQLFACQTLLTILKNPIKTTHLLFNETEQKHLLLEYERMVLVPFIQKHTHRDLLIQAVNNKDAKSQYELGMLLSN